MSNTEVRSDEELLEWLDGACVPGTSMWIAEDNKAKQRLREVATALRAARSREALLREVAIAAEGALTASDEQATNVLVETIANLRAALSKAESLLEEKGAGE